MSDVQQASGIVSGRGQLLSSAPIPSFSEALGVWTRIGVTSFGGPAGQIALMHRILVDEKKWLDEKSYFLALNFCTLLPGPEAMQLATYSGWRLHGLKGGLAAGLLFVLPGAFVVLAFSAMYALYGAVPSVTALFTGVKAAVLAIVIEALFKISKRSLRDSVEWAVAGLSFVAIFFLKVPFPIIILGAGLFGYWRSSGALVELDQTASLSVRKRDTLAMIVVWSAIWLVPLVAVVVIFGNDHVLAKLALFFAQLAIVTFGGAYAVLAYMAQDVVQLHGWLQPGEMLDGLGLAETTPGPLILVTEFVGFLAAFRQGGGSPFMMGLLGALITLWATFVPSFMFIFAGAPYIERLKSAPKLKGALSAITAAVVGVILNLSVWFAFHVLFRRVDTYQLGALQFTVPEWTSIDWMVATLGLLAAFLIFVLHRGVITTLAICGLLSFAGLHVVDRL